MSATISSILTPKILFLGKIIIPLGFDLVELPINPFLLKNFLFLVPWVDYY